MTGNSMQPTFKDGQVIEVKSVDNISSLQRGDIIVFEWNGDSLIKRLVALPGETIEIRQGSIIIDGKEYDEPYDVISPDYEREPIQLGEDEYYVLGDNRNESRDSHNFGPITSEMIKERVTQ
jgi:signal peptidase I